MRLSCRSRHRFARTMKDFLVGLVVIFLLALVVGKCSQHFKIGAHDPNWPGHSEPKLVDCNKLAGDTRAQMACIERAGGFNDLRGK